jgi:hypothetical protein
MDASVISVVTSCSAEGFEKYGQRFVETFHEFWPEGVKLYVVSEHKLTLPVSTKHMSVLYDLSANEGWAQFRVHYQSDPRAARDISKTKQYRMDAHKFCKKVFATDLIARHTPSSRLIWLDADTVTLAPIPIDFLLTLPPSTLPFAYLDRGRYHSECGFVVYNLDHARTREFITLCARMYSSGDVFDLKEWNDCFVFDHVRCEMRLEGYKIPHGNNMSHPFVHSCLGQYMDHLKGMRKDRGVSHDHPKYRSQPSIRNTGKR